ncbi:MAG: riboflavin synthase [Deltaproteobacteria bacterium]|nr:riboflavin synthase [Deltaproteobacteria bacterium]
MFTGIIEDLGTLLALSGETDSLIIAIRTGLPLESIRPGDSIAVNGVCLTVNETKPDQLTFDVSHETVKSTNLQYLSVGDKLHIERALTLDSRLGGHLVSGHVDAVGQLVSRTPRGKNLDLSILAPEPVVPYLVPKGSVAIDGVSLTINEPHNDRFRVTLVPHTMEKTKLAACRPGDKLNLEADILGKYVRHFTQAGQTSKIDQQFLEEHGFLKS